MKLILASKSPRRKEILEDNGYDVIVDPSNIDENEIKNDDVRELVMDIAKRKALAVAKRHEGEIIVAADTLVWFEGKDIGQQENDERAFNIMQMLIGKTHEVYTGICVIDTGTGKLLQDFDRSEVRLRNVSEEVLNEYIASGKYKGKAGAYCITDPEFESFVDHVEGSWNNILGLPIKKLRGLIEGVCDNIVVPKIK